MGVGEKLTKYWWIGLVAIFLLVFEFFSFHYYFTITVNINKDRVVVSKGTTVGKLLKSKRIYLKSGDLFNTDGSLLRKGKGNPPVLKVNGQPANASHKLKEGDRVTAKSGSDEHEEIVEELVTILPPYRITGSGAFVYVSVRGKPGLKVMRVGSKSDIVFSEAVRENPTGESVVRKYDKGSSPVVALTFDDGPHPTYTPQVLSILQEKGVKATFFVVGKQVEKYPNLLKQIVQMGCDIGNHTYSHAYLSKLNYNQMMDELGRVEEAVEQVTGKKIYWLRPPGGYLSPLLVDTAVGNNHQVIMWSIDPADWKNQNPAAISQIVVSNVRPGAVILLHDGGGNRAGTVAALPAIIDGVRAKGYEFVLLDQIN